LIAAGLALALAGCSPAPLLEKMPEGMGGLPANAPARPATPQAFPAVHDMPPPRVDKPMTDEEQLKTEKSLTTARDRLEGARSADNDDTAGDTKPAKPKKGASAAKKKPTVSKDSGTSGAGSGAKTNP